MLLTIRRGSLGFSKLLSLERPNLIQKSCQRDLIKQARSQNLFTRIWAPIQHKKWLWAHRKHFSHRRLRTKKKRLNEEIKLKLSAKRFTPKLSLTLKILAILPSQYFTAMIAWIQMITQAKIFSEKLKLSHMEV